MNSFTYTRPDSMEVAVRTVSGDENSRLLGGGTNLIDLMKQGVERPEKLIDISRVPLNTIAELPDGGLRLGALARNSDTAAHPLVRSRYPLLSQAILSGASPQLRNMATDGGNLLQRTRCYYFYDPAFEQCNKRKPGSGCAAIDGFNRIHAILGASSECIATNPSDMCVALAALEAKVQVQSRTAQRSIAFADFHRLPGQTPQIETTLRPDEMIVAIDLPRSPFASHSHYLKVRDRASYAFALVSVAAALDMQGPTIRSARLALGGVALKPWRVPAAERVLEGGPASEENFARAADLLLEGARTYEHNAFKVPMAKAAVVRALSVAQEQA